MKLWEKQVLFTQHVSKLLNYMGAKGFNPTLSEVFRTPEQAVLYAKQGKGIINSLHCKRLAVDINLLDHEGVYLSEARSYKEFGDYWETLHEFNRWGGYFHRPDSDHFEMQDL